MSKKIFVITIGLAVIGLSLYSAQPSLAQNTNPTLIERIAEKFNLNKDEVQKVTEDFRSEKMKTMQVQAKTRLEEKLTLAVSDGKITEVQKQAFLKKFNELQKNRESERAEMQDWAKQNGLDNLGFGKKFGFGMHKFGR